MLERSLAKILSFGNPLGLEPSLDQAAINSAQPEFDGEGDTYRSAADN